MCQILHVSVSGYYKYRRNLGKPGKDAILSAAMQEILDESPYNDNYGAPRMQIALLQKGIKAGIRSIIKIHRRVIDRLFHLSEIDTQHNIPPFFN